MLFILLQLLFAIPLLGYAIQEPIAEPGSAAMTGAIHFNFMSNKCLDVKGAVFADGTPVQM